jgi:hypothetical protein
MHECHVLIIYYWEEVPKEKTPEGLTVAVTLTMATTTTVTLAMTTLSGCIRCVVRLCHHSISDLYASVDECFQAMEVMRQRTEDFERVVDDNYKFMNWNVRKLFGMVGNMKSKWCKSYRKFH